MRRFAITRPLRLIDNALEYWLAHALGDQAATVQNSNLHDWFYPFCIQFGGRRKRRFAGNERLQQDAKTSSGFSL